MKDFDTLLIGFDFTRGEDVGVLIVGRRDNKGVTDIINAFQGKEARELYEKLVTKKEVSNA